nr:transposase, mutator type [Tanacetum cinerariifolium]
MMKAFRAKAKAVDHVRGDFALQYKQLRDYVMELQQSNPNTNVRIRVESEADHMKPTRIFKRIYVCLRAEKEGFKACMRKFLGFDGTFMKRPFLGQLLTSVSVDPNNVIYSLAYGIVETESKESWTWDRPMISTIEYAREYLMKRIVIVKQVIKRSDGPLTPTATRLFKVVKAEAIECIANFNGGLPESWVHPCYWLDIWKQVYSHHINPIRVKIIWPKSSIPTSILPPNHHPEVGRPSKNRKKSAGEDI